MTCILILSQQLFKVERFLRLSVLTVNPHDVCSHKKLPTELTRARALLCNTYFAARTVRDTKFDRGPKTDVSWTGPSMGWFCVGLGWAQTIHFVTVRLWDGSNCKICDICVPVRICSQLPFLYLTTSILMHCSQRFASSPV